MFSLLIFFKQCMRLICNGSDTKVLSDLIYVANEPSLKRVVLCYIFKILGHYIADLTHVAASCAAEVVVYK